MKKLIIIAALALSLSGCLHWWGYRDQNYRGDNQRSEQRNDRHDNQDNRGNRR